MSSVPLRANTGRKKKEDVSISATPERPRWLGGGMRTCHFFGDREKNVDKITAGTVNVRRLAHSKSNIFKLRMIDLFKDAPPPVTLPKPSARSTGPQGHVFPWGANPQRKWAA